MREPGHLSLVGHDHVGVDDRVVVVGVRIVVKDDVRQPDLLVGKPDARHVAKVWGVPSEVGVEPDSRDPAVGREDLVLLVDVDDLVDGHVELDH